MDPGDGFGPAEGISLEAVVANQGVAVPVWTADGGFVDAASRNAPLLRDRPAAIFARFSVRDGFEPREITARLHLGEETFETTRMVIEGSTEDPHTWFGWLVEASSALPGTGFQVELVEPVSETTTAEPVEVPVDGPAPLGFEDALVGLDVVMVPLSIEAENCNETRTPQEAELELVRTFVMQRLPIQVADVRLAESAASIQLQERGDALAIVQQLELWRGVEQIPSGTFVVGLPPTCAGPFEWGIMRNGVGLDRDDVGPRTGIVTGTGEFEKNLAFLVTFMTNRLRVDCPGAEFSNADPEYPHEDGLIGTWGFGIIDQQLRDPQTHYDAITSCSPSWVSDYGWGEAYGRLQTINSW